MFNLISQIGVILIDKEKYRTFLVILFQLIVSILEVISLGLLIPIFDLMLNNDKLIQYKQFNFIYNLFKFDKLEYFILFLLLVVVGVFVLKLLIFRFVNIYSLKLSYDISLRLSEARFYDFYQSDYETITSVNSSQTITEVRPIPSAFATGILIPLIGVLSEFIVLLIITMGILWYDYRVFLLLFGVLGPIIGLIYRYLKRRNEYVGETILKQEIISSKLLYQGVFGYIDVVLHGHVKKFVNDYKHLLNDIYKLNIRKQDYSAMPGKIIELGGVCGIVIIYLIYLGLDNNQKELFTMLSIFGFSAFRIMPSINRIFGYVLSINSNKYVLEVITKGDGYKNSNIEKNSHDIDFENPTTSFKSEIELRNISFNYSSDQKFSLKNINLKIKKGTKIGFIGKSGSGKTTLVKLLLRFIKESSGELLVDGVCIDENNLEEWRSKLGYVQQSIYLIDGSVKENIAFGLNEVDSDRLNETIRMASLSDFVNNLEDGVETSIGENASKISGGQKQRIGIARSLYRNAEILIMDEATSALDNDTENEITETINKLAENGITVITIAHRISTLRYCDVIYEMDNGKIIGQPSYNEIFKKYYNAE